jgi:hypothetical protein
MYVLKLKLEVRNQFNIKLVQKWIYEKHFNDILQQLDPLAVKSLK